MRYEVTAIFKSGRVEKYQAKSDKDKNEIVKILSKLTTVDYVNAKEKK